MKIDWITVIAQIVNFLVLVWLLRRFLYGPVTHAMAEREERIVSRLEEARQREDEAEEERRRYREKVADLERERDEAIADARKSAADERQKRLDEARNEIDRQRRSWRDDLRREQDDLRSAVREELAGAAVGIARRALADLADAGLEGQIAATLLRQWSELPEEKRRAFANGDGPLRVSATFDLDREARQRLRDAVGNGCALEFAADPDLVCGIALAGGGHRLDWNIQGYLDDAERRIRERLGEAANEAADSA